MKNNSKLPNSVNVNTNILLELVPIQENKYGPNSFNDYLLIISPPENIKKDVNKFKKWLAKNIGLYAALHSTAHITIANFYMHQKYEPGLKESLRIAAAEEAARNLTVCNFDSYTSSSTLHLKIIEVEIFKQIIKNINQKALRKYLASKHKFISYVPHITIAKNLGSKQEVAVNLFKDKIYFQTFKVTGLMLLKRNNSGIYEPLCEFPFLSQPSAQSSIAF